MSITLGALSAAFSFTVTVTDGAGSAILTPTLYGFVWTIKTVVTGVTGSPSVVYTEEGGMGQSILTVAGTTTTIKYPRTSTHAVADGVAISGSGDPMLLTGSQLKCTVSGGTGSGTITATLYLLV